MGKNSWEFIGNKGEFVLENADRNNSLYFPIANEVGMMSSVTPTMKGDAKTGHNTFALEPISIEDLNNKKSSRNFWVRINDKEVWSATGVSAKQEADKFSDNKENVELRAGLLWQKVTRENSDLGIKSEIVSFVPATDDTVELMKVEITNTGDSAKKISATAAIPIYGRSADNLRDHRNVTSLLNRVKIINEGIVLNPTLSFDERGHKTNEVSYSVFGASGDGKLPVGFYPILEDFIGESGSMEWPETIIKNIASKHNPGDKVDGYEAIGGLQFEEVTLEPNGSKSFVVAIVIDDNKNITDKIANKYCSAEKFDINLEENKKFWDSKLSLTEFSSGDKVFDNWMKWVTLQPVLRRIYGCSFLPHHDYGRGGRGWRDLWQDCLALLLMEPEGVREMLLNNFAGVRIDGTNATIIGTQPGEFLADRNNITRVWMDHGAWPFLTTKLYIDQSGDLDFLLETQTYFKDSHISLGNEIDENWDTKSGNKQKSQNNKEYNGTILEHILLQHLVLFYNVGEHNNIRLEGADWNDGLDMAEEKGESVTFTALYGNNMIELANILEELKIRKGTESIEILEPALTLIDSIANKVDYNSINAKRGLLKEYFEKIKNISGNKAKVSIDNLVNDLRMKGEWIIEQVRTNEWIKDKAGKEWFNGYYDNDGNRLEGDNEKGIRMTLTGQVFPIMGNVATNEQIEKIIEAADTYLRDDSIGGYRLNTDFKDVLLNMGRAFGFAFGHKENGAMFSHMAVMYGNALYQREYCEAGFRVLDYIYNHCVDFERSKIYPGIPEYINQKGVGMYHYLTGSASWMLLTVVTQMFGVAGDLGDLKLSPKLLAKQFDSNGKAAIKVLFADRPLEIEYNNEQRLQAGDYKIKNVKIDGKTVQFTSKNGAAVIKRDDILKLPKGSIIKIEVKL